MQHGFHKPSKYAMFTVFSTGSNPVTPTFKRHNFYNWKLCLFSLYRKVLLSENLGTKIARSKAGIVNQTVWIKRCKSPLHQNRHHQGYQIHVRNNPYPEVRRHSCHGLL